MIKNISSLLVATALSLGADACLASEDAAPAPTAPPSTTTPASATLTKAEGLIMLDYETIKIPGAKSIDLMGFHFLNKLNDWMYLGVGGYAPLFKGEYGGFMAFDVTAHAQRKVFDHFFVDTGVSMGGGGGGKSVQQSKSLSGTGGFIKSYVGLGYDFKDFSVGANIAKIKFTNSAIDNSQLNVFFQVPFSYTIGSYASSGSRLFSASTSDEQGSLLGAGENTLVFSLDNLSQIKPEGAYKGTIGVADLQFSHFITPNSYWYFNLGVGYHGLPLYNHMLAGLGHRVPITSRVNLYGQLALGSGGYAPDTINTGPGLLIYPKVSAEYMLSKNVGASLSAGYLLAPKGSSKNYTFGAALTYHLNPDDGSAGTNPATDSLFSRGYRFNVFQQTERNVSFRGKDRGKINLLSVQIDNLINDHVYIPIQAGVAYNAYLGYPGYGELLAGIGVQNKYSQGDRLQWFGQLLAGTNVHGPILKTGLGMNYGLNDRLAIYGLVGTTFATDKDKFKSNYIGLGITHRFSLPSW